MFGFVFATVRDARTRLAAMVVLVAAGALLLRAPSSFWWYYQNVVMACLGVATGLLARNGFTHGFVMSESGAAGVFTASVLLTLMVGKAFVDGPNLWRVNMPSRAQGYQYLAAKAVGDGTYDLPGIGTVVIKNPEIGMTSYFSGDQAWIWDGAGLAQPLDSAKVTRSALRRFFPKRLRESALTDAEFLASKVGKPLPVVEVWAMEDRNFEAARKKCRYVIEEGAICANEYVSGR